MAEPVVSEDGDRQGAPLEVDAQLVDDIAALIDSGQRGMVLNLVTDLHPADLSQLLTHVSLEQARTLFAWLTVEQGGDVLPELDSAFRAQLLEETRPGRVAALLEEMDTDDATDVLADLPEEVTQVVLPRLEDAADLQQLLAYHEETAGGIMAREFVSVPLTCTVAEATEEVRHQAETIEQIYVVYVVDEEERLKGIVPLKSLLLWSSSTRLVDIMKADHISVTPDVDQEEVARIMERYDLVALPVVDSKGRLIGRITIDDVVDVIREEAEEDIQLMSGVTGGEAHTDSVLRIIRGRLPWLFVGLAGAALSGGVIGVFEDTLEAAAVLATFIPIVMATAGNAGIQSSAIIVQGLASGDLWASEVLKRLGKEMMVALINGLALGVVLGALVVGLPLLLPYVGITFDIPNPVWLAVTACLSLISVIQLATVIGTAVPLLLHRSGIDPAIATGPFITTSNDILGLTVFFLIATLIYL